MFINDNVFDSGLAYAIANGSRIDLCSVDPVGVYATVTANTLGNKTGLTPAAASNGLVDGRRSIVPAITDGTVTGTGTASHWALTNGTSTVIASGPLTASQAVTSGNVFTLDAISITLRDAA